MSTTLDGHFSYAVTLTVTARSSRLSAESERVENTIYADMNSVLLNASKLQVQVAAMAAAAAAPTLSPEQIDEKVTRELVANANTTSSFLSLVVSISISVGDSLTAEQLRSFIKSSDASTLSIALYPAHVNATVTCAVGYAMDDEGACLLSIVAQSCPGGNVCDVTEVTMCKAGTYCPKNSVVGIPCGRPNVCCTTGSEEPTVVVWASTLTPLQAQHIPLPLPLQRASARGYASQVSSARLQRTARTELAGSHQLYPMPCWPLL